MQTAVRGELVAREPLEVKLALAHRQELVQAMEQPKEIKLEVRERHWLSILKR